MIINGKIHIFCVFPAVLSVSMVISNRLCFAVSSGEIPIRPREKLNRLFFCVRRYCGEQTKTNKRFLIIISQLNDYSKATGVSGTKRMLASPISKLTIFTQAH